MCRLGLLLSALLLVGCGTRQAAPEQAPPIIGFGLIVAKEAVDIETAKRDSRIKPRIYASISSGGGFSVGLGFLLSSVILGQSEDNPTRYQIAMQDGEQMTVYHLSPLFEIDDCVMITTYPDDDDKPVEMTRSRDGCES